MSEEHGLGAQGWRVFAIVAGAVFMVSLDATVVVAAFPALRAHFQGVAPSTLAWVLNAYTIVYAALLVPMGRRADRRGRRRAFLEGLALFTFASAGCALAPEIGTLIAARAVQAVGAALLTPAALALLLEAVPLTRRAVAVSLFGAVGALAAAFGPAFGSWVIDLTSWRAIFWINLPLGLLLAWRGRKQLAPSAVTLETERPDWFGATLLVTGVAALTFGLGRIREAGLDSSLTWEAVAVGLGVLSGFVAWAWGRPGAALDLGLFRERNFRYANLATLIFGMAFSMMFLAFFLYMTGVWHYSQSLAGLAVTPGPLAVIPFAVLSGRVAARRGYRGLLIAGGLLFAVAQLWYFLHLGAVPNYLRGWLPGQLLSGAAIGLLLPSLTGAAVARLPGTALGSGNAVNAAIRQIGAALGIAVAVAMVGQAHPTQQEFRAVYLILAGGGLLTALLALPIDSQREASV